MRILLSLAVFLFIIPSTQAQDLGVFAGANTTTNYPFRDSNPHLDTHFSSAAGYSLGLELGDVTLLPIPMRISGRIDRYSGDIAYESSGLGGGYNVDADQENYCLTFGLHFLLYGRESPLQLSLGVEYAYLLKETFTGTATTWSMATGIETTMIDQESFVLNTKNRFMLTGTVGYRIVCMPGWYIEPRFSIMSGMTRELQLSESMRAMRFLAGIGIGREM